MAGGGNDGSAAKPPMVGVYRYPARGLVFYLDAVMFY
jgi:hypothetical protein